jgi:inner membrane protein
MPTVLSHPAVPLAVGLGLGGGVVPLRLLLAGVAASVLPDLDVLAFRLGIPYHSALGHRGFSHSPVFAALVGLLGCCFPGALGASRLRVFAFLFVSVASHGILDAFTTGGRGVAFLWPFSSERFFAPLQVIAVAPIRIERFFSPWGINVVLSELKWIWAPCAFLGFLLVLLRPRK